MKKIKLKFYEFFLKKKFIKESKKISISIKNLISKKNLFNILDIGAGARYLPSILNFDGSSKIYMVDPNKNLNVSVKNLSKNLKFKKNIVPIKTGIYTKNTSLNYYLAPIQTSSSFIKYDKKLKPIKKKVYSFSFIKKKYNIGKVDILKIDIEGLEFNILKSVLNYNLPLIIEIETNFKSSAFGDTFSSVHNYLSKKYFLKTAFPVFEKIDSKFNGHLNSFRIGSYASPSYRNPIMQMDCYYILRKKSYDINDMLLLFGYGFIDEAKNIFENIKEKLNEKEINQTKKLFKILYEK